MKVGVVEFVDYGYEFGVVDFVYFVEVVVDGW